MGLVDASILAHPRPLPRLFRHFKSPFFATQKATDRRISGQPAPMIHFAWDAPFVKGSPIVWILVKNPLFLKRSFFLRCIN
jgi:hypothetical protein